VHKQNIPREWQLRSSPSFFKQRIHNNGIPIQHKTKTQTIPYAHNLSSLSWHVPDLRANEYFQVAEQNMTNLEKSYKQRKHSLE
jgi:hypothetical protein